MKRIRVRKIRKNGRIFDGKRRKRSWWERGREMVSHKYAILIPLSSQDLIPLSCVFHPCGPCASSDLCDFLPKMFVRAWYIRFSSTLCFSSSNFSFFSYSLCSCVRESPLAWNKGNSQRSENVHSCVDLHTRTLSDQRKEDRSSSTFSLSALFFSFFSLYSARA